ncbi:unnamed protein product [Phaedon cochleariae]|uniref:Peptidase C14A caspase catalytic domain-containing protein n=1 Tax=Phaedon cochleariae TaxID=80249 RepID=A0A9N9X7R3_PHACE|nr:unnamed protein product [Phaedon cochleariae]
MDMAANRISFVEEDIEVKPSPELIPDEYEHFQESASRIAVHIFAEKAEHNVTQFCDALKICGIHVNEGNKHSLRKHNYKEVLDRICNDADNIDGLIILFCGISNVNGAIKMYDGQEYGNVNMENTWSRFYSYTCRGLKNKPKIFIFSVSPPTSTQTDAIRITFEQTYDTPAEADILIIYSKTSTYDSEDFIENLCHNITEYGKHEDIISLVTCVVSQYNRPLVISTLTRKFYLTTSDVRGHHLTIQNIRSDMINHLKEVEDILKSNMTSKNTPSKEKKLSSIFGSFRLRKKKEKKEEKKDNPEITTVIAHEETQLDTSKIIQSTPSSRRPSRIRLSSQTELDGVINSARRLSEKDKKPVWRP